MRRPFQSPLRMIRERADSGRITLLPATLLAAVPYVFAVWYYMDHVDPTLRLQAVLWDVVIGKAFLALAGPVALCAVWLRLRPSAGSRWAYDWLGAWMAAFSMAELGAIGWDLLDPYQLNGVGQMVFHYGTLIWVLCGIVLLVGGVVYFTRILHKEQGERQRLEALMRFTRRITTLDHQMVLEETVSELYRLLQADGCILYLWDEKERVLLPAAGVHNPERYPAERVAQVMSFRFAPGLGITGDVFLRGEPVIRQDGPWGFRGESVDEEGEGSWLLVPLLLEERKLGVVRLTRVGSHPFTQEDLDLVRSFAGQGALMIERSRLVKELSELSITDSMTGLFNARHFHKMLEREVQLALRHGYPLSLIMMDSDSLKQVNDHLGHPVGDAYLKEIARVIQESIRRTDLAFRYAGDEFIALLPMTDANRAMEVGERIRTGVQTLRPSAEFPCSISLGVATMPTHVTDGESLLVAADEAMYHSKRSGKNRTSLSQRSALTVSD